MKSEKNAHDLVKKAYGEVARQQSSCCSGPSPCCEPAPPETAEFVPEADLGLSCGDPVALSHITPGDIVLDLGSGAGKDVFIAARKTGPTGRVIGIDMTPEMIDLARKNAERFRDVAGYDNIEFRHGLIEQLPVEDESIDLVISNCVINLSPDKLRVFREIYRVLKPGGKMVVSDIVLNRELPDELKCDPHLYASCIAGALLRDDYIAAVRSAGFPEVDVLKEVVWKAEQAAIDPITTAATSSLSRAASSITLFARK